MYINKKDFVLDTDIVLSGFTFRDLLDTAHANGDDIKTTLEYMIAENVENARERVDQYADELNNIL